MPWFRVDDGFPEHPKLEALEARPRVYMAAITVWLVMGADCARRLLPGTVTAQRLAKSLGCIGRDAMTGVAALVEAGLWEVTDEGWQFHDWAKYQPSKASVEASRESKRLRQARWRGGHVDASTRASTDASTAASLPASRDACPTRAPGDGLGSGSDPDPDAREDHVEPSARAAQAWLREFCADRCRRKGEISYNGGIGATKATAVLAEQLAGLTPSDLAAAWEQRAAMFDEFWATADGPRIAAGMRFSWFVQRWEGYRTGAKRGPGNGTQSALDGLIQRQVAKENAR